MKKILLLGSGELGKEFVIAAMRAGQYVIACDRYNHAPAMQVADEHEVFNMLDSPTSSFPRLRPSVRSACLSLRSRAFRSFPQLVPSTLR